MTTIIVEIDMPDVEASDLDVNGGKWFPDPEAPECIAIPGRYLNDNEAAWTYTFKFVGIKDDPSFVPPDDDAPVVITYDDGTTETLPSRNQMKRDQEALEAEADKYMEQLDKAFPGWLDVGTPKPKPTLAPDWDESLVHPFE